MKSNFSLLVALAAVITLGQQSVGAQGHQSLRYEPTACADGATASIDRGQLFLNVFSDGSDFPFVPGGNAAGELFGMTFNGSQDFDCDVFDLNATGNGGAFKDPDLQYVLLCSDGGIVRVAFGGADGFATGKHRHYTHFHIPASAIAAQIADSAVGACTFTRAFVNCDGPSANTDQHVIVNGPNKFFITNIQVGHRTFFPSAPNNHSGINTDACLINEDVIQGF